MPRRGPAGEPGVKLTLTIDSTRYDVEPLLAGTIRLEKEGGGRYLVNRSPVGVLSCNCPNFVHRAQTKNQLCRHATALNRYGLPLAQEPRCAEEPENPE